MKVGFAAAGVLAVIVVSAGLAGAQALPDSPRPQTIPNLGSVAPGKGSTASTSATAPDDGNGPAPTATLPSSTPLADTPSAGNDPAPDIKPELGPGGRVATIQANVNFVQVPFTVKDKSGALVPALDWREVRIFENGTRKQARLFSSDPYPLSVAFVIDQSLPFNVMDRVNVALGALQGAFTPYDEMAIFTYNNGPTMRTDYTGAQSSRITAVIQQSKGTGREAQLYTPDGPLSQTTNINGKQFDPNTSPVRNSASTFQNPSKETHTLNDAIFMAAQSLAKRPIGRRRIIYVISDGKEYGSKTTLKENVHFMQTNQIALYATVVGESSTPYVGFLDHYHIPFTMRENILPQYASQTGGESILGFRQKDIESSFAKIAEDVRVQYTVGYYSNEPITDGKFRTVEVQVLRPGLDVIAKKGYYPMPESVMRTGSTRTPTAPR